MPPEKKATVRSPRPRRKMPMPLVADEVDTAENRLLGTMAYFWIFFMVPLVLKRQSPFAQFHAKQGAVLAFAWFCTALLSWVPLLNILIAFPAMIFLGTINLLAIIRTWHGQMWKLPYLYRYVAVMNL